MTQDATDPTPELLRMIELATDHPDLGPPLAALCFKLGQKDLGERVVRLRTSEGQVGIEFHFVRANAARREQRFTDAVAASEAALEAFATASPEALGADDGERLLQLLRAGFAVVLFDLKSAPALESYSQKLNASLPGLEARLGKLALYHPMMAQTLWSIDKTRSEAAWDRAVQSDAAENAWNSRGTWYKEAERDTEKAEATYRKGLEHAPRSALLRYNLAQLLLDRIDATKPPVDGTKKVLREAEDLLRSALREEAPRGIRRFIHTTLDKVQELRGSLGGKRDEGHRPAHSERSHAHHEAAAEESLPKVGDVLRGKVKSLTAYGAFVAVTPSGRLQGLLHISELAHEEPSDPAEVLKLDEEIEVKVLEVTPGEGTRRTRISLSRKALLPAPPAKKTRLAELLASKLKPNA